VTVDVTGEVNKDTADKAIAWLRLQNSMAPDRPFFACYATATAHAPHHEGGPGRPGPIRASARRQQAAMRPAKA
jgi:arylsulfatase A-like enzyme